MKYTYLEDGSTTVQDWAGSGIPSFTTVGTYVVTATVTRGTDYIGGGSNVKTATSVVTINKVGLNVTVTGNTDTLEYDGKNHSVEGMDVTITDSDGNKMDEGLVTTYNKSVTTDGATNTGTPEAHGMKADKYLMGMKYTEGGADNTISFSWNGNYEIKNVTVTDGYLEITKKPLELTAGSNTKTSDGSALTEYSNTITGGTSLADSDELTTVTYEGSQTAAGTSANKITSVVINHRDGSALTDVTDSYALKFVDGTLTVNEASNNNNDNNGGTTIDDAATPLASVPAVLGARREPAAVPTENGTTDNSKGVLGAKRGAATGDDSPIAPWAAALVLSLGLGGIMITDHKKRRNK